MGRGAAQGQAFSVDLLIGVLVFMLAIGIIYSLLNSKGADDPAQLRIESEVIAERLTSAASLQVAPENQLNMEDLAMLAKDEYEEVKAQLGVQEEFCIYLQDENGNLIYIQDSSTGERYAGVGSGTGEITLTDKDIPCGQALP